MGAKLKSDTPNAIIQMCALKDGELAVMVGNDNGYDGQVVQAIKNGSMLIFQALGCPRGETWSSGCTLQVRRLQPGELIEVTSETTGMWRSGISRRS